MFKLDEAGLVYVEDDIVPAELVERAKEGSEACPQVALQIVPLEG